MVKKKNKKDKKVENNFFEETNTDLVNNSDGNGYSYSEDDDNHILELFKNDGEGSNESNDSGKELFTNKDIKTKTEINEKEIHIITSLQATESFLRNNGLPTNFIGDFVSEYLTLKISLDRQSRKEFVDVKKADLTQRQAEAGGVNINNAGMR